MTNLLSRLERLEREQPATRPRIIWIEPDETREEALRRSRPLEADEAPEFVGWEGAGHRESIRGFGRC
jgi:hypothetical protein